MTIFKMNRCIQISGFLNFCVKRVMMTPGSEFWRSKSVLGSQPFYVTFCQRSQLLKLQF